MYQEKSEPPHWALKIFRWFCHPEMIEDIEGDLLERFNQVKATSGLTHARRRFVFEVMQLLRPGIMINPFSLQQMNADYMNRLNWIKLVLLNVFVIIVIMVPFFPGPPNRIVIALSAFMQSAGFFGLILIPLGMVWLIFEIIRSQKIKKGIYEQNKIGFVLGIITVTICSLMSALFAIASFFEGGVAWGLFASSVLALVFYQLIKGVFRLKKNYVSFNSAPLYLLTIPLIALCMRTIFTEPLSKFSRHKTIERAEKLIGSIESFKDEHGRYPESLNELKEKHASFIAGPNIMGILDFRYNKIQDSYSLSFSQWLEMGSLEEFVLYDKNGLNKLPRPYDYSLDLVRVNGAPGIPDSKYSDWSYYRVD